MHPPAAAPPNTQPSNLALHVASSFKSAKVTLSFAAISAQAMFEHDPLDH